MTEHLNDGGAPAYFGLYPAIVTDIVDPDRLGRVKVRFPWLGATGDNDVRAWATLCTPYADDKQGLQIMPEVDSQVVVGFEAGNLRRPYVVGAAWNGTTKLPHDPGQANNLRELKSRSGSRLVFDDTRGAAKVQITMQSGHKIVLDDAAQEVTINHANGCSIKLTAAGSVEITGNLSLEVSAPIVNVDAAISTFSGIVKCGTLIAEQMVMSPAYTPGAGNFW